MLRISRKEKKIEENFFFACIVRINMEWRRVRRKNRRWKKWRRQEKNYLLLFSSLCSCLVDFMLSISSILIFKQNESHKRTSLGISWGTLCKIMPHTFRMRNSQWHFEKRNDAPMTMYKIRSKIREKSFP